MNICVMGLWHLGCVTAACLSSSKHHVIGLDFDPLTITNLQVGKPPLFEPGLEELIHSGLKTGTLEFTNDPERAIPNASIIWITYDTPVDDEDRADVGFVIDQVKRVFPYLKSGQHILISSQVPVGTTTLLRKACPVVDVTFSYSPENLRLGKAISVFTQPDRVVIGTQDSMPKTVFADMLKSFTERIEWMSVESAEMTKHALNAFLAISVTFANEIAILCEKVGADAKEVERGLKTEARIGPKAYLGPGGPFAGGTLARDIAFLQKLSTSYNQPTFLFSAVRASNDAHKLWIQRKLQELFSELRGKKIAIWGLTYKPETDTLRRSSSVELCEWLNQKGALIQAHDPAVTQLPESLAFIELKSLAQDALVDAQALIVATAWPQYQTLIASSEILQNLPLIVIDINRFLAKWIEQWPQVQYVTVGKSQTL